MTSTPRPIVSLMHVSLDGFVAKPDGDMSWIHIDETLHAYVGDIFEKHVDTAIYGRTTYGMMHSYWPTAAAEPDAGPFERAHSVWVEQVEKLVFSKSDEPVTWNNARLASKDLEAAVREIKGRPGGEAMIFGSPRLTRSLAAKGLIDEYRLTIQPIILGKGIPLFDGAAPESKLSMVSTKAFESGVIAVHYRVLRD